MSESDFYTILPDDYSKFDQKYKLVVIGDPGVGKSCLTKYGTTKKFDTTYTPTIGFEYYTFKIRIKETDIQLQIWDTCGQENYRSLISSFYHNSSLAILVFSINNMDTFKNLELWMNDIKVNSNPDVKIFLVGNKSDLEDEREVLTTDAEEFSMKHGISKYMETSAKTGFNSEKLFAEAANILYQEYIKFKEKKHEENNNNDNKSDTISLKQYENPTYTPITRGKKRKCC